MFRRLTSVACFALVFAGVLWSVAGLSVDITVTSPNTVHFYQIVCNDTKPPPEFTTTRTRVTSESNCSATLHQCAYQAFVLGDCYLTENVSESVRVVQCVATTEDRVPPHIELQFWNSSDDCNASHIFRKLYQAVGVCSASGDGVYVETRCGDPPVGVPLVSGVGALSPRFLR